MLEIIAWVKTHLPDLIEAYLALIGLASVIVKFTPTMKDDDALKGIIKFVGKWIALDKYGPPNPK